jgi:CheY-like chemotaxis protein
MFDTNGAGERQLHVLIVEDKSASHLCRCPEQSKCQTNSLSSLVNRKIFRRLVEKIGFTVDIVFDGQQALNYLANCQSSVACPRPDIILMDV